MGTVWCMQSQKCHCLFFDVVTCLNIFLIRVAAQEFVPAMPSRTRSQAETRRSHVCLVSKKLAKALKGHDDLTRIHSTNRILPPGSLQRKSVKKLFSGWIAKWAGKGRCFTKKLAAEVCSCLRDQFEMDEKKPPVEEVVRMHQLLKMARKKKLRPTTGGKPVKPATAMASIDEMETLPFDQVPSFFWILHSF